MPIQLENGLRPDQVGIGLPASTKGAGSGYVSPQTVVNALDTLARDKSMKAVFMGLYEIKDLLARQFENVERVMIKKDHSVLDKVDKPIIINDKVSTIKNDVENSLKFVEKKVKEIFVNQEHQLEHFVVNQWENHQHK